MSTRAGALSAIIGLAAAGLFGCGTVPAAGSPGTVTTPAAARPAPAGSGTVSAGSGVASPGVIVTMPASPPGGATGAPSGRRQLTVADDGVSVRLRTGQAVTVVLDSGGLQWDIPRASGTAVRRISGSGGYPAYRPAVAVFRAVRPGRSWLTSFTDAKCLHTQPRCEIPQRLWRALIIVGNT